MHYSADAGLLQSRCRTPLALVSIALGALLALMGCTTTPTESDAALARAERLWQETLGGADRYVMRQQRRCFCLSADTMRVTVTSGRITAIINERTGAPAPTAEFGWYRTVSQLFDDARALPARGGRVLEVRYHPAQGYPTLLSTDPIPGAADDEVTWVTVSVAPGG